MELSQLRDQYPQAANSSQLATTMWRSCRKYAGDEAIIYAYQAAARALMSHHSWNPLEKLDYLKESMRLFRKAVKMTPENPEVRFLRFSIQTELPAFLSMNQDLEADKAMILARLPYFADYGLDAQNARKILAELKKSGRFREEELRQLSAQMEA